MDYLIETEGKLDMTNLRDIVLSAAKEILGIEVRPFKPTILDEKNGLSIYILGRLLLGKQDFDSVLAYHMKGDTKKRVHSLNPDVAEAAQKIRFSPNLAVGVGLQLGDNINVSPDRRYWVKKEAILIGNYLKEKASFINDVAYVDFSSGTPILERII